MTVPATARRAGPFLGNDSATSFPFTFKVFAKEDIAVTLADADGAETALVGDTDYSVSLNTDQDATPGGSLVYPVSGSPLPTGSTLTVAGALPYDQTLDLPAGGNFSPLALENALDRTVIQVQQIAESVGRAATLPVTTPTGVSAKLPLPAALETLRWNATADALETYAPDGAASLAFLQAGTGAVLRDAQNKMRDFLSVKDFGAVGDGVTSDQTAVAAAVAAADLANDWLYWPDGTYLCSATIPGFHSVRHYGPGVLRRGGFFYITPDEGKVNFIYVSPTGSNANDGLNSTAPKLTLQAAIDAVVNYKHALLDGTWKISLAAGSYAGGDFPAYGLLSLNPIEIIGPTVGGHPNVPTARITDGANFAGNGIVATEPTRLFLRNVEFFGYQGSNGANGLSGFGVYTENVHCTDCHWGISVSQGGSFLNIKGGVFDHCGYLNGTTLSGAGGAGLRGLFHVKMEIGTQDSGTLANGPIFRNSASGIFTKEYCTGHIDWCTFEDNLYGVQLWTHSRANLDGSSFKRNSAGIRCVGTSNGDPSANTVFGTGVDANTTNVISSINSNASGEQALAEGNYPGGFTDYRIKTSAPNTVVTAISSANTIDSYTPVAGFFTGPSYTGVPAKKLRVRVKGTLAGTTGTYKRIALRLGASTTSFASFGATNVGDFVYECEVDFIATANQVLSTSGFCTGFVPLCNVTLGTVDMTVNQVLALQAYVQNAADSITIKHIEWFLGGV